MAGSTSSSLRARLRDATRPFEGTRVGRFAVDTLRAARGLIHSFRGDSITLRAGNLTFITITSLLPLLAVILALLHWLKQQQFELMVFGFIQDVLAPGAHRDSDDYVRQFFAAASSRTAGGLSFVVLLFSSGILLRSLDVSLNEVWGVRRKRLLFGPTAVGLTLATTSGMRRLIMAVNLPFYSQLFVLGSAMSAVAIVTLLYKLAPHAPVRWRSALAGGLVAGLGWEIARNAYAGIARLFLSANPVYGALGIAPLFLMWLYLSWCLVLFGARLAYAVEHAAYRGVFLDLLHHPRARELLASRIAQLTTRALLEKAKPPTSSRLATKLGVPAQLVDEVVHQLESASLLTVNRKGEVAPARDPAQLTLADVSAAVGGVAMLVRRDDSVSHSVGFDEVEKIFSVGDDASVEKLSQISWASLADGSHAS
jgi:membrane protein